MMPIMVTVTVVATVVMTKCHEARIRPCFFIGYKRLSLVLFTKYVRLHCLHHLDNVGSGSFIGFAFSHDADNVGFGVVPVDDAAFVELD